MASPAELIEAYRFRRVVGGRMGDDLPEEEILALITCPKGAIVLDRAIVNTHEWEKCPACDVEVCLEDALGQQTIKVIGIPNCQ